LVGSVELGDGLRSEELFGCRVEAVGVALDRLEEPGRWVVELPEPGAGGERRFVAGDDLLAMGLTTILTTIRVYSPKYGKVQNPYS
jgi:hypothetical protein